jgi:hypothetical protein
MNAPASSLASPSRVPRGYATLAALGGLVLLVMLVRLAIFAQAPAPLPAIGWSVMPWNPFIARHACATAYWKAATVVDHTPDVYHRSMYGSDKVDPSGRPLPQFIGPFAIDPYEYPPTFLLLPRLLALVTPEFPAFRLLWGVAATALTLVGVALIARRVDRENGTRSLWLAPLALLPLGVFSTLQGGNAQLFFVAIAMLGMLAFERGRHAVGGLLLGYAVVGKLFPGLLVLYLVARRDWRAAGWTVGWGIGLTLVTIADVGWAPFAAFAEHMPKLLSGEAFPMLRFDGPSDVSHSIPGLVLKLKRFGGPVLSLEALSVAGTVYTVVIAVLTVRLGLRPVAPRLAPLAWLVVLGLATLRSPFLPGYGVFQGAWVASLLLALCWSDVRMRVAVLALWASLLWTTAGPLTTPLWIIALATTAQTVAVLVLFWLAIRIGRAAAPTAPAVAAAAA